MRDEALPSQADANLFRIIANGLASAARDRGVVIPDAERDMIARFFMEYVEERGLRMVPLDLTREMQSAIDSALDTGKRMSVAWVGRRRKNRWRYQAAIEAAPNWRRGFEARQGQTLPQGTKGSQEP